jgi:hypothetical protein
MTTKLLGVSFIVLFGLILFGCGGSHGYRSSHFSKYKLSLTRSGGFSGVSETFEVSSDDSGKKFVLMPGDDSRSEKSLKPERAGMLERTQIDSLSAFLDHNFSALETLHLSGTGNLTTTLKMEFDGVVRSNTWANLDPPLMQNSALDTLYARMLHLQALIAHL